MTLTRRALLASAAAAMLASPSRAAGLRRLGGPAFGSYWRLTLPASADAAEAATRVAAIVTEVDARMSPYRSGSELSRFNRLRSTAPLPLHPETARVTRAALDLAAETGGAFDPTLGPLVARLGFGPIHAGGRGRPDDLALEGGALRKARGDLTLDLCGIAKGHALDRIAAALEPVAPAGFLVELGGEVAARGRHPEGRPWQIAVEGPAGLAAVAELDGIAVATSGDAAQGYALGQRRYGHIVDPATSAAPAGGLASVSVFDVSAMRADALATALFAMGGAAAENFARARGIEALLVPRAGPVVALGGAGARLLPGGVTQ